MYGTEALRLLQEVKRSTWLPQYNDQTIRAILKEMDELYKLVKASIAGKSNQQLAEPALACPLIAHHESLLRNKRCVLAYLAYRIQKIKSLWWETRGKLPDLYAAKLSDEEKLFFSDYDELVGDYINSTGIPKLRPPTATSSMIQVRALQSSEDLLQVAAGTMGVPMSENSAYYVNADEVDLLIRHGVVQEHAEFG